MENRRFEVRVFRQFVIVWQGIYQVLFLLCCCVMCNSYRTSYNASDAITTFAFNSHDNTLFIGQGNNDVIHLAENMTSLGTFKVGEAEVNEMDSWNVTKLKKNQITLVTLLQGTDETAKTVLVCLKYGKYKCHHLDPIKNKTYNVIGDLQYYTHATYAFSFAREPDFYVTMATSVDLSNRVTSRHHAYMFSVSDILHSSLGDYSSRIISRLKHKVPGIFSIIHGFQYRETSYYVVNYTSQIGTNNTSIFLLNTSNLGNIRLFELPLHLELGFRVEKAYHLKQHGGYGTLYLLCRRQSSNATVVLHVAMETLERRFLLVEENCSVKQNGFIPYWINPTVNALCYYRVGSKCIFSVRLIVSCCCFCSLIV